MPTDNKTRRSVAVLCLLAIPLLLAAIPSFAVSPDVVISQVYGGGGNNGAQYKNDFIELFNRGTAPVDLTGWSVQYASATGSSWTNMTALSGTIQPGQYYLIQEAAGSNTLAAALPTPDFTGGINMSGTAGKVALVNNATALSGTCPSGVVDFVGFGSTANCFEGAGPTPAPSNTTSVSRTDPCADADNNSAEFTAGAPNPRNTSSTLNVCGGAPVATNPNGTGAANPNSVVQGSTTLLTVAVNPGQNPASSGLTVTGDLTAIGGAATQQFYDDGTNGDVTAGDNTYSFVATVPASVTEGSKSLAITVADAQTRSSTTAIAVTVVAPAQPANIHDIQGNGSASPLNGQKVSTTGIVTAVVTNDGGKGFYMQAPEAEQDSDPATSEGVFVYTGSAPTVSVGDAVEVTGAVKEYLASGAPVSVTEITSPSVSVKSTGNALPSAIDIAAPVATGTIDQLERYEGMRVRVASLGVTGPTDNYGVFYVISATSPRPFREPGVGPIPLPTGMPANVPHFDYNPERIRVNTGSCSTPAVLGVGDALPEFTGTIGYANSDFTLYGCTSVMTAQPAAAPLPERNTNEFTVASFNMLNFTTDAGRIAKASKAIREIMRTPDVIGVEEVNTLATLQALAAQIDTDAEAAGQPKPGYTAQLLATSGSQNVGLLYRSARITDVSVVEVGGDVLMPDGKTKVNDRAPLVMTAKVTPLAGGDPFPITVIVNHLRSLIDVDALTSSGDYARTKRQLGAEYLANLVAQHQTAGENVISVGDYNAYEFNDGYVDVLGTVTGKPALADQVLLASNDLVDPDAVDLAMTLPAEKRYSYVENGNAQTLDHIVVTSSLLVRPYHLEIAHNNADFPETLSKDTTRSERVSDHDMPVAYFTLPPVPAPHVTVSATSLDFGHVAVGASASRQLQLTNDGTATLNLSSISTDLSPTFTAASPDCGTALNPGATCTILVAFRPNSAESFTANLTIADDADGSPHAVTLSGVGVNTTAKVEPASIDFGDQIINAESASKTIAVTNTGSEPMFVNRMEIQLPTVRNDSVRDCMGALAVGESCQFTVVFKPSTVGPVTGVVTIGGNFDTLTVSLAGKGVEPPTPGISVSPASLDFAGQMINGISNSKTISVANNGTAALNISKIEISGEFSQTNNCPASLAAGANCTVSVNFAPKSTGTKAGAVTITHDAAGSPTSIALAGMGTDFAVATPANGSTSAAVTAGQTATYNLQIAGTDGFNGAVALSCAGAPAKTACTVNPANVNVTGTTAAAFTATVTTTAPTTTQAFGGFQLPGSGGGWPMLLAMSLAGMVGIVVVVRTGKRQMRLAGAFGALLMVVALSSCGGSSSLKTPPITVPGTATGTYTITITATSGSVSHDIKLTLKVN